MRFRPLTVMTLSLGLSSALSAATYKELNYPAPMAMSNLSPESLARQFLSQRSVDLNVIGKDFVLSEEKESLLAHHLTFQQVVDGVPVRHSSITITIDKNTQAISRYYNTLTNAEASQLRKKDIGEDKAYDAAWAYMGVQQGLFLAPRSRQEYVETATGLKLVYAIELAPSDPYGVYQVDIDAESGAILDARDARINEKLMPLPAIFGQKRPTINRQKEFQRWSKKSIDTSLFVRAEANFKDGGAQVFDPDPKTELNNDSLKDNSPASAFDAAYVSRPLRDLTYTGSVYKLEGPWVRIIDFDSPTMAPSTSKDGQWNFKRGNGAFNDAMTYFHIDQSQRYIQSLGFRDEKGIQFRSIEADSNGANGADNSYFLPSGNRLSFGWGCVDDNEDADVILHEYGHAIHSSINSSWSGGDTGAMGEGFGDYWAVSYSVSTEKGHSFNRSNVYTWDGGDCWAGRVVNAMNARYDHNKSYGAHSSIGSGMQSDELWATPLSQALFALMDRGIPREEVDTIVLEAQFGLGARLKMRDMAQSVVSAARKLYPNGPHAETFRQKFMHHGILDEPRPILSVAIGAIDDTDGALDPGESVNYTLKLQNTGDLAADGLRIRLTSSSRAVSILTPELSLASLAAGGNAELSVGISAPDSVSCGQNYELKAVVTNDLGQEWVQSFPLLVGRALLSQATQAVTVAIPDNKEAGVTQTLDLTSDGVVSNRLSIGLNLKHSYRGDLKVTLTSPGGKSVLLHNRTGSSEDNLIGSYPATLSPAEPLSKLLGESLAGTWTLKVQDLANSDTGSLESWSIEDITGYECR